LEWNEKKQSPFLLVPSSSSSRLLPLYQFPDVVVVGFARCMVMISVFFFVLLSMGLWMVDFVKAAVTGTTLFAFLCSLYDSFVKRLSSFCHFVNLPWREEDHHNTAAAAASGREEEMAAAAGAAFPPPPPFYKLFKDFLDDPSSAPSPPPPVVGTYTMFGGNYTVSLTVLCFQSTQSFLLLLPPPLLLLILLQEFLFGSAMFFCFLIGFLREENFSSKVMSVSIVWDFQQVPVVPLKFQNFFRGVSDCENILDLHSCLLNGLT
jgi:hypothetical protein